MAPRRQPSSRHPYRALALWVTLAVGASACGLRVTNEPTGHDELTAPEQDAVATILAELSSFNEQVKQQTRHSIESLLSPDRIQVDLDGMIVAANLGDGRIHISSWEALTDAQRRRVQQWFDLPDEAETAAAFRTFFYRFLAVSQGAKQLMYEALTTDWVYDNRSLWSVERDSIRVALAHFATVGRSGEIWPLIKRVCRPIITTLAPRYRAHFTKQYLYEHVHELIGNLEAPEGYMYFLCRWADMGFAQVGDLADEFDTLQLLGD